MSIFYQHIGEQMWLRDGPKSIGTKNAGLRRFTWQDIEAFLHALEPAEQASIREVLDDLAPTGFQIWGIPSGAMRVLEPMAPGDFLMLLESSDFAYVGQVLWRVSEPLPDLSFHIWGESRFPLIILLQGEIITYGWDAFVAHFSFDRKYHMRGTTARLTAERISQSPSATEDAFISQIMLNTNVSAQDLETDFKAFAPSLQAHYRQVKQRAGQKRFRQEVLRNQGHACAVCDLAISVTLDAAHLVEKEAEGSDDWRNGLVLCSLHHRLLDAHLFFVHPKTLQIYAQEPYTLLDLRISRQDIAHLTNGPHRDALRWRWNRRVEQE